MPDYVVMGWNGVGARARVPGEIVTKLGTGIRRALAAPDIQGRMSQLGLQARASTAEEMGNQMARDVVKWREVKRTEFPGTKPDVTRRPGALLQAARRSDGAREVSMFANSATLLFGIIAAVFGGLAAELFAQTSTTASTPTG